HVLQRHATRTIIQRASTGALTAALFGDVSGLMAFAVDTATTLGYSREQEAEADAEGLRLLRAARLDPRGRISFFDAMTKDTGRAAKVFQYVSTHPSTEERLASLRAIPAESDGTIEPALSDGEWRALRLICERRG